jgi:sugar lactone lactonase YvrE
LRPRERMLAHLALAIAPIVTPVTVPTPHTLTAMAPIEVWATGLGDLRGIAVDAEGRVWVTDHARGRVLRLDAAGAARVVAVGLQAPVGIAIDPSGRVLVAEEDAGRIVQITAPGTLSVVAGGLERPRWLAVAEDGTIYVSARRTSAGSNDAEAAGPGVVLALRAGAPPVPVLHGLRDPEGLAVGDGVLYVATRGRAPGYPDAVLRLVLGAAGDGHLSEHGDGALRGPVGLALDATGTLFVTAARLALLDDQVAGVVARLAPTAGADADVFAAGADRPQGLAFDGEGNLYLAERGAGRIVRFLAPRPPQFDPLPAWTREPGLTLSGRAEPEARVEAVAGETVSHAFAGPSGVFALPVVLTREATNRFDVRALGHDGAGLASPAVAVGIVHDATPPALVLDSPPTGATVRGTVDLRATAADPGSGIAALEVLVNDRPVASAVAPPLPAPQAVLGGSWLSAAEPDGIHALAVRARDRAGNATTLGRAVIVDNTPPHAAVTGPFEAPDGLRFAFAGHDDLTPAGALEFAWRIDDGPWSPFSTAAGVSLAGLSPGAHQLEVTARDRAGNEAAPVSVAFAAPGGALRVTILEPPAGAVATAGPLLVRGTVEPSGTEVGVTVNGTPGWLDGVAFTAVVDVESTTTSLVVAATAADGRTGSAAVPIAVTGGSGPALLASPWSGPAPLTVRWSLSRDPQTVRVELDADGDGAVDFAGESLDDHAVVYAQPGVHVARAALVDAAGIRTTASAVIRVFDGTALDGVLRARWSAMRDALRRGDVAAGVSHIVGRRRADYEAAFRLLSTSLPAIDTILTDVTPIEVRNASAIYEMRRTDDGILKSFEIRFAIDGDGIWRLEAF